MPISETSYSELLNTVLSGGTLSVEQARCAFGQIMEGAWSEPQIAGLLVALANRGESISEITGAAMAMREHVRPIATEGMDVIDTCGTGGTGLSTFNVSTAAALVTAGAGVKVAKHGNRTTTRSSGSADVLAELGVNIEAGEETVAKCLKLADVCFCFAVRCHPAMKYAAPVRRMLGVRTIFNLLGPLTNPAGAKRQLLGVYDANLTETIAQVLQALGTTEAMVIHAEDGLDELSTMSPTRISHLRGGRIYSTTVSPEDFGLPRNRLEDLVVSSARESANTIRHVLAGREGPPRDIVVLNAGAALATAGKAQTIVQGIELARQSIDSGAAARALELLVAVSHQRVK